MVRLVHVVSALTCVGVWCAPGLRAAEPAMGSWSFDGDLLDASGHGNDAYAVSGTPTFAPGREGRALVCGAATVVVPDSPALRLAPGLRVECTVKLSRIGRSWQEIVIKDGGYQLRIDPQHEGGHFSFFVHLGGWEPRVRSNTVPTVGLWYHLAAGWDGQRAWIEVNGERTEQPRRGNPSASQQPLEFGRFDGLLADVRLENPRARDDSVARWTFSGNLRDSSGNGHHLSGETGPFVPGRKGQACTCDGGKLGVPTHPDLELAPGFRVACQVMFDRVPNTLQTIVIKDGEYQLRVNPPAEGGGFAFFVYLDGSWEPREQINQRVEAGVWYRITASWDGFSITLDVNGRREESGRQGVPAPTDNPVRVGGFRGQIDELWIENPRTPVLRSRRMRQEHALLRIGRPERLTFAIHNVGIAAETCQARLVLAEGIRCLDSPTRDLGRLEMGEEQNVAWRVQSDVRTQGVVAVELSGEGLTPFNARQRVTFFPAEDALEVPMPPSKKDQNGTTYCIDAMAGNNGAAGTSPETAWRDFSRINGKTLGPGDSLLIRRGSVINQELSVSASGTPARWARIGAYGEGARPIIRGNWDIGDRCVLIRNPDYLHIRSLVVCCAAKGLVVYYSEKGHRGLLIEDCIAHHIEGLYRPNAHGIPEWRHQSGPGGDGLNLSAGIATTGALGTGLTIRDCEMFQASWGYFVTGNDVVLDRVYCHDNHVRNTSPHPAIVQVRRCVMQNCVLDASGWHASAGTMGIMLVGTDGLVIRNCTFRNMPDAGNHDQGGIDFESGGNGCLIDECTFENNAGAAVEVLGLRSPQATNIEIRNSRFLKNNWADKLGPAEIFIWGRRSDPTVCCSTGWIRNNGYVLLPNVTFFVNEAPETTAWTLSENRRYGSVNELEAAMPFNRPPVVDAGPDLHSDHPTLTLSAQVSDDGRPGHSALALRWECLDGPVSATFSDAGRPKTTVTLPTPGDYMLRLVADDGELWISDTVAVHRLVRGMEPVVTWDFNTPLDKEGWTDVGLGTKLQHWANETWPTKAHPVKYVAGGYYILALEDTLDAHLLSPDGLAVTLEGNETVVLRFQNHTPATRMRLRFTTATDAEWDERKARWFNVTPDDTHPQTYEVDMHSSPGWKGRLRQLRLDLGTGTPLTGTCRFDYIWILRRREA